MIEIRTGSDSDISKMREAYEFLERSSIPYTPRILSAHRTPDAMVDAARNLNKENFRASICAAGGAAHLPGMTASETLIPVIGLPIIASTLNGLDSFYSIVQMPDGIPVGTVGAGQSRAATELAMRIAYLDDLTIRNTIRAELNRDELEYIESPKISVCSSNEVSKMKLDDLYEFAEDLGVICEETEEKTDIVVVVQKLQTEKDIAHELALNSDAVVIALYLTDPDTSQSEINFLWSAKSESIAPVAMMGLNRTKNAVLYAAQIQALYDKRITTKLINYRNAMKAVVEKKNLKLEKLGVRQFW